MRTPRPLGTTELGSNFNRTLDNDIYINLQQNIINHYIRNNFSYCGHYMNIEQFSHFINLPVIEIQRHFTSYGKEVSKLIKDTHGGDIYRAIQNLCFKWGLEDRSLAQQQYSLLAQSQGNSYAPFISGEVNKSIRLMMDSNQNLMALMRSLPGNGMPLGDEDPGNEKGNGVTIDDAIMLLKENGTRPLLEDNDAKDKLYLEYDIENMPEVCALHQDNYDSSKEGLNIKDITSLKGKKIKHSERREEEFEIDLDQDDV